MRPKPNGRGDEYEFRSVTDEDLEREQKVIDYVGTYIEEWQQKGYIPDMVIEKGITLISQFVSEAGHIGIIYLIRGSY